LQRQCIANIYDDYSTLCHKFNAANNAAAPYLSKILMLLVVYVLQHQYICGMLHLVLIFKKIFAAPIHYCEMVICIGAL
jgi:hypothetical protein